MTTDRLPLPSRGRGPGGGVDAPPVVSTRRGASSRLRGRRRGGVRTPHPPPPPPRGEGENARPT
jgi:hypothetical protein